tara:strand:+ start:231 stop:425 length:195 start_codon:yes stop_codon:yes gene_type:complete
LIDLTDKLKDHLGKYVGYSMSANTIEEINESIKEFSREHFVLDTFIVKKDPHDNTKLLILKKGK